MEKLKQDLYDAFYWYFREEYAMITNLIEDENQIEINQTKISEIYIQKKIEEIIKSLKNRG